MSENRKDKKKQYEIGRDGACSPIAWIKCLKCGMKSYNQNDVMHKYCGKCHEFLK